MIHAQAALANVVWDGNPWLQLGLEGGTSMPMRTSRLKRVRLKSPQKRANAVLPPVPLARIRRLLNSRKQPAAARRVLARC